MVAEKTTLMKLICMLIQPTDGFVLFDGEDIRMHRSNFWTVLDTCPNIHCLYPDFTVQEYLYYVGALKGMHKRCDVQNGRASSPDTAYGYEKG